MGLHDGSASSAALAERLGLPVLAVIDAGAMAQTFGAIALGLKLYRPGLDFAGVIAKPTRDEIAEADHHANGHADGHDANGHEVDESESAGQISH